MKKIFLSALTIFSLIISQQTFAGDTLYWKNGAALSWSDFKGKTGNSPTGTGAYIGLDYTLTNDASSFKTKVTPYFLSDMSWSKFTSNDTLLQHEQIRFDMAELFARRTRKAFSEYNFNAETVVKDLKKIFNEIKDERVKMNQQFDKETKYATDLKAQQTWSIKISTELDKLSAFAE